jgi:DeoR/GlpR family transcriptional regulator of sugar metabolism
VLAALELIDETDTAVVLTGGQLRPGELSLIGPAAEETLANYNCDTFVMGWQALTASADPDYHQAESVKRAASRRADWVIVAADKSKLGRHVRQHHRAGADRRDLTDGEPEHPTLVAARAAGVDVVCVGGRTDSAGREVTSP